MFTTLNTKRNMNSLFGKSFSKYRISPKRQSNSHYFSTFAQNISPNTPNTFHNSPPPPPPPSPLLTQPPNPTTHIQKFQSKISSWFESILPPNFFNSTKGTKFKFPSFPTTPSFRPTLPSLLTATALLTLSTSLLPSHSPPQPSSSSSSSSSSISLPTPHSLLSTCFRPQSSTTILASFVDEIRAKNKKRDEQIEKNREWFHDPADPYIDLSEDHLYKPSTSIEIPDKPPYRTYDMIRYATERMGGSMNVVRQMDYDSQLQRVQDAADHLFHQVGEWDNRMTTHQVEVEWDVDDPGWHAALWEIYHATPRYKYDYKHISLEKQASMVQYGLQVAPPLWINGVVYPSLGHFMSKEGFIHKADGPKHFSMWTPISLWSSWLLVIVMYRTGEAPRRAWFDRHMTCSYDNRSRPWGLLTSAFTHVAIPHFLMNSAALFAMTKNLGTNSPLPLWAMFSIISFFASTFSVVLSVSIAKLLLHRGIVRPGLLTRSVGASGGLTGLFAINALTHQDKKVNLRILPVEFELIDLLALLMGIDVLGFMLQICGKNTGISHSGHLGGYISGIVLMNIMKKKYEKTYPPGSYEDYINWAENIYFPKPRNDIYIPAQDTSGVLIKHRTAHNTYLR